MDEPSARAQAGAAAPSELLSAGRRHTGPAIAATAVGDGRRAGQTGEHGPFPPGAGGLACRSAT